MNLKIFRLKVSKLHKQQKKMQQKKIRSNFLWSRFPIELSASIYLALEHWTVGPDRGTNLENYVKTFRKQRKKNYSSIFEFKVLWVSCKLANIPAASQHRNLNGPQNF